MSSVQPGSTDKESKESFIHVRERRKRKLTPGGSLMASESYHSNGYALSGDQNKEASQCTSSFHSGVSSKTHLATGGGSLYGSLVTYAPSVFAVIGPQAGLGRSDDAFRSTDNNC